MPGSIGDRRRFEPDAEETAYLDELAIQLGGASTYRGIAIGIVIIAFNLWDRLIDPAHADRALLWRVAACVAIALVHGIWVWSRHKTYRLYRRLVLTHTLTVPLGIMGAVTSLDGGVVLGLYHVLFVYMWLPSVLPFRRDAMLGALFAALVTVGVTAAAQPGRAVVANAAFFSFLGVFWSTVIAAKFDAAFRRGWSQERAAAREARTDSLTGAVNRRRFAEAAAAEAARARRYRRAGALILFDLDAFKQINDEFGHPMGDAVLKEVVTACGREIRNIDLLARFGGDEFAVLLPETSMEEAVALAERLRQRIAGIEIAAAGAPLRVTASFGVARLPAGEGEWEASLAVADAALYRAKAAGRNRTLADVEAAAS